MRNSFDPSTDALSPLAAPSQPGLIVEADQKSFMKEAIDASRELPVLVDFWAPWCGPCRQLTPVLEKIVQAAAGRVKLVKVNIEANKALAAQLGQLGLPLQSIPLVVAFWKGQVLDLFQGAQTESAIRHFVESLLKLAGQAMPTTELATEAAQAMTENRAAEAAGLYAQILESEPENPAAWGGLIRALTAMDDFAAAEEALSQIPPKLSAHAEITAAHTALTLRKESREAASELDQIRAQIGANPDDFALKMKLAASLNGAGQKEEAAETLLEILRKDRTWQDGAAKTELLRYFEAWGHTDPVTLSARRKLSSLLFS